MKLVDTELWQELLSAARMGPIHGQGITIADPDSDDGETFIPWHRFIRIERGGVPVWART